ncbi:MAG: TetR/AcrR family transcriptional regulator [Nocardioides sp.]|nr:TetR/AcrR family transcriptional regulator [Nocardioidaceae bacterium]MCB8957745.1 TetR/AcrR family transcriptional regulator [Nocardioides sp.]
MAVQSGVYRGVSAQERAAERRERLLEATLGVWADPEVSTTMTNVCARAGLSERYFYESFANLDAAQTAVLDQVATEIETRTQEAGDLAGPDPAARALASVSAFVQLLVDDPRKGRVAIVEAAAMPSLRPRRTELMRHFAHRTAESARELGLSPLGGPEDELAGLLFIGGVAELVTAWLDGVVDATPDELVAAAARSFLALYR